MRVQSGPQDEAARGFAITGFKPPPRWEILPRDRPSFPQLLASASRGQGSERAVITLSGKRLPAGTTLQQFSQQALGLKSQPGLANLRVQLQSVSGWFSGQRTQIDATLPEKEGKKRPQVLREFMFINPPFGYVLTLIAPQDQALARYRDLEDIAGNLVPLSPPPPVLDAGPTPPPDAGTLGPQGSGSTRAP